MGNVEIHPTAIVHKNAVIGEGTRIGPYSLIGEYVELGKDCDIQEHVVLRGHTKIGDRTKVFPFAVIGGAPQHTKYKGEPTRVEIGNDVVLRESSTVHLGTEFGGGVTVVHDGAFVMAYAHVAHDCAVGRNAILANSVQLAGHVMIEDFAVVGGLSAIAQFCRVGTYCYVGGGSILRKDLAPFLLGKGTDFCVQGVNVIGLQRQGFSKETIMALKKVYRTFYMQKLTVNQAIEKVVEAVPKLAEVEKFIEFVRVSRVGLIR